MKLLFWNTYGQKNNDCIIDIVEEESIDIVVLAEYKDDIDSLIEGLKQRNLIFDKYFSKGCERVVMLGKYKSVTPSTQDYFYSIQVIQDKYILCGLHLPSDTYNDSSNNRYHIARRCIYDIQEIERTLKSNFTIIVGDMNEMPYELSVLSADSFHGLPNLGLTTLNRTINGESFKKYYNPMWNLFGDFNGPPGTYYRSESKMCTPMWYMLDQFILSDSCAKMLNKANLKIITSCQSKSLITKNGTPNKRISDHLPIMCEILEEVSK